MTAQLFAPPSAVAGGALVYTLLLSNNGNTPLNGTQVRLTMPSVLTFGGSPTDPVTVQGSDTVFTAGRLAPGEQQIIQIKTRVASNAPAGMLITPSASLTSGTAQPVAASSITTKVVTVPGLPPGILF